MSLANYADLKAAVANWLNRTDLTAVIPDFIALAEVRFNRELRLNAQDTVTTGTVSTQVVPLPSDLIDLKRITITANGAERDLRYVTPEDFDGFAAQAGRPFVYTSMTNNFAVAPGPDAAYPYAIYYSAKFPALATASTNWLMTNAPDVYLYGALLEASPYLRDDSRITVWAQAYAKAIAALREQDENMRYSNANIAIRAERWA